MLISFLVILLLASGANAACPAVDDGEPPLVYAIDFAVSTNGANSYEEAKRWFAVSELQKIKNAEPISRTFSNFVAQFGHPPWRDGVRIDFLTVVSELGDGFATFKLSSELHAQKKYDLSEAYLAKAVRQKYPPAYLEYANWLVDDDINSVNDPKKKDLIYDTYMKSVELGCGSARLMLADFIDMRRPDKRQEIKDLLLPALNDPELTDILRKNALELLCKYTDHPECSKAQ